MMMQIIQIEMIKTINEIRPNIGLIDTFHPRRVDLRTSALEFGGLASVLGRAHSMGHRVVVGRLKQRRRSNGAASPMSIGGGFA